VGFRGSGKWDIAEVPNPPVSGFLLVFITFCSVALLNLTAQYRSIVDALMQ